MSDDDAAAPVRQEPEKSSVGRILRDTREARQLSLLQVSEELRIEPRSLNALEEDRFDALGAPVFVKGYLKNYAECLGLDARALLEIYRSQRGDEEPVVRARHSVGEEQDRPIGAWAVAAMAVALIAAFLWLRSPSVEEPAAAAAGSGANPVPALEDAAHGRQPPRPGTPGNGVADGGTLSAVDGLSGTADVENGVRDAAAGAEGAVHPEEAATVTEASGEGPAVSPQPDEPAAASAAAGTDTSAALDTSGADTSGTLDTSGALDAPGATAALDTPGTVAAGALDVELRFMEDSWAEVTGPGDERLYYGLGRAGAAARFSAAPPIDVLLGNADGVAVQVDGEPFSYPSNSRSGNLAQFTLSAAE